jgi:hypothetical protein
MAMLALAIAGNEWTANLRAGRASVAVQNQSMGGAIFIHIGTTPPSGQDTPKFILDPRKYETFVFDDAGQGVYLRSEYVNANVMVW